MVYDLSSHDSYLADMYYIDNYHNYNGALELYLLTENTYEYTRYSHHYFFTTYSNIEKMQLRICGKKLQ